MISTDSTTMQSDTKRIAIASRVENIAIIEKAIDEICAKHNISEEHYGNVLIAITEGVNNAISHGNKQDPEKEVVVEFITQDKKLVCKITDQGPGFDFENVPDPTSPENIEKPNGRGVFLMRHLSDGLSFEDNGAIAIMEFGL
jgi:serine/threonine-protein kinase RsbW